MGRFAGPLALAAALTLAAPAAAQIRQDVTVNPNATGTKVLLYPGGKYGRVVRPLLQPGEADPNAPIVLHMPRRHPLHRLARAKAKPKVETAAAAPPSTERTSSLTAPPPESAASLVDARPVTPVKKTPPPPQKKVATVKQTPPAKPAARKTQQPAQDDTDGTFGILSGDSSQVAAPPQRMASTAPSDSGGATHNSILFAPGAEEPPASALETVKSMVPSLNTALWTGTSHIQLEAYGGKNGDKSSDARRLSLKRALIIRQLLIDDGIPSEKIVVRAMGGAPNGVLDRVDIFVAA